MEQKILAALEEIRPMLNLHAGDLEFVRYDDNKLYIRFKGACVGCPLSEMTLKMGIEKHMRERIPSLSEVVAE